MSTQRGLSGRRFRRRAGLHRIGPGVHTRHPEDTSQRKGRVTGCLLPATRKRNQPCLILNFKSPELGETLFKPLGLWCPVVAAQADCWGRSARQERTCVVSLAQLVTCVSDLLAAGSSPSLTPKASPESGVGVKEAVLNPDALYAATVGGSISPTQRNRQEAG